MQLNPRESFTIVRQIEDHTDSATYYVRAVIRNAKTDALIETINLTDRGSLRFSESWLVPADGSGQGFWVSILTSVYTDSGYTTKSENYGDKMETYLVQDRVNVNLGGIGGGGSDIDYKRIQKMIDEALIAHKPDTVTITRVPEIMKVPVEHKVIVEIPKIERVEIEKTIVVEKIDTNSLDSFKKKFDELATKIDDSMATLKKNSEDMKDGVKTTVAMNMPELNMEFKLVPTASRTTKGKEEKEEAEVEEKKEQIPTRVKSLMKK